MKLKLLILLGLCVAAGFASQVRAETADDIIALAQKNTAEDVLLATVEHSKGDFNLSVADILKLREANVPNTVITAMLKHKGGAAAPAGPAPAPAAPAAPVAPAPAPVAPAPAAPAPDAKEATGTLELENIDAKTWAYRYEPEVSTIWIVRPTADAKGNLPPSGGTTLRMKAGTYKIRYNGQDRGPQVTVFSGEKSMVLVSRVDTAELEALYASVFEHNEKKPGGRLIVLRENPLPQANSTDTKRGGEAAPPPVEGPVVEREIVETPVYVAPPPPTVIYRYPGPYYYPRYYPYSTLNFGYFQGGRHSRFGVGLGFGF
jgi:hypothetical protein